MGRTSGGAIAFALIAAIVLGALSVAGYSGVIRGFGPELAIFPAILAVVMIAGLIVSVFVNLRRSKGRSAWFRDAVGNGFSYTARSSAPGLPGILFRAGEKTEVHDVVDALASPTPFLAGTITGTYAADSSLPRNIAASFIAMPLPQAVPNIMLVGSGIGMLTRAGVALAGRQKLSLEGDFNNTFTLYCPTGYERDALYIFAPDLMARLIDTTAGCDVELVDDWMFVYSSPGRFTDEGALGRIMATTELVQQKTHRQTRNYTDDRAVPVTSSAAVGAPRTVSPEEHAAGAGAVGVGGQRLRTRASGLQRAVTVVSSVFVGGALIYYFVTEILPTL